MHKTKIIEGNTPKDYEDNLNVFFEKNKDIEIIDIKHFYKNFDFLGIITYWERI